MCWAAGHDIIDKLRFGAAGLLVSKIPNGRYLEKHTADGWSASGKAAHNRSGDRC